MSNADRLALVQSKQVTEANEDELLRIAECKQHEDDRNDSKKNVFVLVEISLFELELGKIFDSKGEETVFWSIEMNVSEHSERNSGR